MAETVIHFKTDFRGQMDDFISFSVNVLTVDLFRKLLSMKNYVDIVPRIGDSDAEVFLDFLLYASFSENLNLLSTNDVPSHLTISSSQTWTSSMRIGKLGGSCSK